MFNRQKTGLLKYIFAFFFFITFFLVAHSASATTYYVDATGGNDSNNGTSTGTAWQTTTKVTNVAGGFVAGDSILFKRGETWTGTVTIAASGTSGNPITFGAYGSGVLPVINGSTSANTISISAGYSHITVDSINLTGTNVSNALFNIAGTSDGITLSNCTLSGTASNAIKTSNAQLTVSGCSVSATVINGLTDGGNNTKARIVTGNTFTSVYSSRLMDIGSIGNFTFSNNTITTSSGTPGPVFNDNSGSGGTVVVSGNTINLNVAMNVSASTGVLYFVNGPRSVTVDNNTINSTISTQGGNIIYIKDQPNATISNNIINTVATSTLYSTIRISASANVSMPNLLVTGNTLYSHSLSNYILYIGEDAAPAAGVANMIDGAIITHNKIYGGKYYDRNATSTVHGFLYGYNKWAIVRYNYFNASVYVAMKGEDDWGYNGDISYNIFDNNDQIEGLMIKGPQNIYIHNNTFYINPAYSVQQGHLYLNINSVHYATGIIFKYNILVGGPKISMDVGSSSGFVSDYNIYYTTPASNVNYNIGTNNYSSLSAWQAAGYDTHSTWVDPKLVDPTNADFHIQQNSPAINTAASTGVSPDYVGTTVPQGSLPDIGAYEFLTPSVPSSLEQYKSDGTTVITHGSQTNESTVVMKFSMASTNASDLLTPQIEVQETGTSFTNTPTNSGTAISYSGSPVTGVVTVSGLVNTKNYHWQARVTNTAGSSSWVPLNLSSATDFNIFTSAVIATPAISGITAPVTGATPTSSISATTEYTAAISWSGSPVTFAAATAYTATITITPKAGYTLTGVAANFFTVSGATATNSINTGVVSAVFPATIVRSNGHPVLIPPVVVPPIINTPVVKPATPVNNISTDIKNTFLPQITKTKNITIKQGVTNNIIKTVQQFLNSKGYTVSKTGVGSKGNETSYFGLQTKKALIKFQKDNKLTPNGILGPKTKALIKKILEKK